MIWTLQVRMPEGSIRGTKATLQGSNRTRSRTQRCLMPKPSHEALSYRMKEGWNPEDSPKCFSDVAHLVFETETHWPLTDLGLASKPPVPGIHLSLPPQACD